MIEVVERCPWCGSKITHSRFVQIQDAIRKDEQRKLAALEKAFDAERAKIVKRVELSKQEADKLRGAFPEDQIARAKGGMLVHEVRYKSKSAGKIVIDSKSRAAWQHAFVTKLRETQSDLGAEHAILATPVFPSGKKELFVDAGVI